MQERHKALGCTLVLTSNHLITLREDFTAPLRRVNSQPKAVSVVGSSPRKAALENSLQNLSTYTLNDVRYILVFTNIITFYDKLFVMFTQTQSILSTSTRHSSRRSSNVSSPMRTDEGGRTPRWGGSPDHHAASVPNEKSSTSMSSIYGKNSGVEIKTCASLQEMSSVRIPSQGDRWWCILVTTRSRVESFCRYNQNVFFFIHRNSRVKKYAKIRTTWSYFSPPTRICGAF